MDKELCKILLKASSGKEIEVLKVLLGQLKELELKEITEKVVKKFHTPNKGEIKEMDSLRKTVLESNAEYALFNLQENGLVNELKPLSSLTDKDRFFYKIPEEYYDKLKELFEELDL